MDFEEESSISKINTLVNTFRDMCCEKDCLKLKDVKSRKLGYTNFTVHEIMKPNFGGRLANCDSDSDGTYHSESGSGWNSSGDESHDNDEGRCGSACSYYYEGPVFPTPVKTNSTDDIARPFSIFQRFKQQFEEDGYSSSDSESALDLRIARKKTPPKLTKQLPAWVFCTRYSDRPSAGRRPRKRKNPMAVREKRSRIAFNDIQLRQLNIEFEKEQYLSEDRRQKLADELDLNEANVKIWFQNKRAKLKKEAIPHPLAVQLKEEGLYNHKLVTKDDGGH